MEKQGNPTDNSNTDKTTTKEDSDTGQLAAVASKWILDFLFSAICRRFKERNHDAFNGAISTYECKVVVHFTLDLKFCFDFANATAPRREIFISSCE